MSLGERIGMTLLGVMCALILFVMYLPAIVVVLLSFFADEHHNFAWENFTLNWYGDMLGNSDLLAALWTSVKVGLASVTMAISFALVTGYYFISAPRRFRPALETVIFIPFVLPAIIIGVSMVIFFREISLERSLLTVVIGHTTFVLAVIYRMIMVRLDALGFSQIEASRDLGATEVQTFLRVVLPQLKTAIITAGLLAFTISFDETLVTFFLTGPDATLPLALWAKMRIGFTPDINALVVLVLAVTFTLAAIGAFLLRQERHLDQS